MTKADAQVPDVVPEAEQSLEGPLADADRFGPYAVLYPLPETGLGQRFRAERTRPVRRRVTLHVMDADIDAESGVERFRGERQRLSSLDDPRLAPVRDAGVSDRGRLYFVSAPVQGALITSHCARHRLGMTERLRLFAETCDAVHRAHQSGSIHGRIVPATVLVTSVESGLRVSVTELGLAAALTAATGAVDAVVQAMQRSGLAAHVPPEHLTPGGVLPDTRSDVYGLGVLLYELLTGAAPFEIERHGGTTAELQRAIRETAPDPPSERVGLSERELDEIAAARRCDPADLKGLLRDGLDAIALRCLAKDPSQRYAAASELASEVRRYAGLDTPQPAQPVAPGGVSSMLRRVPRRAAFAVGLLVALAVLGMAGALLIASVVRDRNAAERAAEAAGSRAEKERRVSAFLLSELLAPAVSERGEPPERSMREALDRAAASAGWRLGDDSSAEADVRCALGAGYRGIRLMDKAQGQLERCVALYRADLGDESSLTLGTMQELAAVHRAQQLPERAEELLFTVLTVRRRTLGSAHAETRRAIDALATLYVDAGRDDDAEPLLRERLTRSRQGAGPESDDALVAMADLGQAYARLGRVDDAEALLTRSLAGWRRSRGDEDPRTMHVARALGRLYKTSDRPGLAASAYALLLDSQREAHGDEHPATIGTMIDLGTILVEAGRFDDAEPLLEEAVFRARAALPPDHPLRGLSTLRLGAGLTRQGRFDDAEIVLLRLYRELAAGLGRSAPSTVAAGEALVELYDRWGRKGSRDTWQRLLPDSGSPG